jgi:ketosteroid isomerase-like protein
MLNPIEVVLKFETLINARNAEALCTLFTSDAVFIDSLGNRIEGARMQPAWEAYFKMVPDYSISHSEIFANGESVALFGSAQGTFSRGGQINAGQSNKDNSFTMPAAWHALVRDGKIALWQVFADNEPIRAIMRKPTKS